MANLSGVARVPRLSWKNAIKQVLLFHVRLRTKADQTLKVTVCQFQCGAHNSHILNFISTCLLFCSYTRFHHVLQNRTFGDNWSKFLKCQMPFVLSNETQVSKAKGNTQQHKYMYSYIMFNNTIIQTSIVLCLMNKTGKMNKTTEVQLLKCN